MLGWVIWDPPAMSKKPSSNVLSDINSSLKTESVLKLKICLPELSKVAVLYQSHLSGQQMKPCFYFVSHIRKKAKQYAPLTGKQGRRHYKLGCVIHLPSWVSQILLLNKSWLYQEVSITSGHQQFQQLGQPFRCQSKYILLGVGNAEESIH